MARFPVFRQNVAHRTNQTMTFRLPLHRDAAGALRTWFVRGNPHRERTRAFAKPNGLRQGKILITFRLPARFSFRAKAASQQKARYQQRSHKAAHSAVTAGADKTVSHHRNPDSHIILLATGKGRKR